MADLFQYLVKMDLHRTLKVAELFTKDDAEVRGVILRMLELAKIILHGRERVAFDQEIGDYKCERKCSVESILPSCVYPVSKGVDFQQLRETPFALQVAKLIGHSHAGVTKI